jgi:nitrilase
MPMLTVAIAQAAPPASTDTGVRRAAELIGEAAERGAKLVAFPETWLPGYPAWLDVCRDAGLWDHAPVKAVYRRMHEEAVVVPGPACDALGEAARQHGCVVVMGVVERVVEGPGRGTLYNTLLTFGADGQLVNHHRKLVPTYTERLVWGGGDAAGVRAVDTAAGRVGGLICWEHWMPLARQALHESGEDIHVASWPMVKEMALLASRHYAFEGRCHVLAAGGLLRASELPPELEVDARRVAGPDAWVLRGGSAIIAPDGTVLAGPVHDEECVIVADIDVGAAAAESMTLDVTGHYARADQLRLVRAEAQRHAGGG